MQSGNRPWGQLLEAEDWGGYQGVPQVENLLQEEGEFSLTPWNMFYDSIVMIFLCCQYTSWFSAITSMLIVVAGIGIFFYYSSVPVRRSRVRRIIKVWRFFIVAAGDNVIACLALIKLATFGYVCESFQAFWSS